MLWPEDGDDLSEEEERENEVEGPRTKGHGGKVGQQQPAVAVVLARRVGAAHWILSKQQATIAAGRKERRSRSAREGRWMSKCDSEEEEWTNKRFRGWTRVPW